MILCTNLLLAQQYSDYIGNGHDAGIQVTSSHSNSTNLDNHLLTGAELFTDQFGASRFLRQASMGANYETIDNTSQTGLKNWLDAQFALTPLVFSDEYDRIYGEADFILNGNSGVQSSEKNEYLAYAFYELGFKQPDVLRQKVAFALSQIFVISLWDSKLHNEGYSNASYYDILYSGAFGNYRDILFDVAMHPIMGLYLSHFQNRKADIIQGRFPDENFSREIMQLFTIGLNELNPDGSFKLDAQGKTIPTYDNEDIQELAKVFTGLSGALNLDGSISVFGSIIGAYNLRLPMKMFQNFHDKTEKTIVGGNIIPANQAGMDDINQAIDVLFNHENVGPFIGKQLIQHLVKSNPSPQYINRVSAIFNDNGRGVRGDLEAVVAGILLDPEARDCEWINDPTAGKLIQPLERFVHAYSAFDLQTPSNKFWLRDGIDRYPQILQAFLRAPSVFNFYSPLFSEKEFVSPNNLVSPEFQILNSTSGIHYLNTVENMMKRRPFGNRTLLNPDNPTGLTFNFDDDPFFDLSDELNIYDPNDANSLDIILDRLDLILCSGQLKADTKLIIKNTVIQNQTSPLYDAEDALNDIFYYIMISPEYNILK